MTIYAIPGLGADKRVFEYLELDHPLVPIEWVDPKLDEPIDAFAMRLTEQMDLDQPFVLMGLSFGGLIAVEMAKKIKRVEKTILLSSAAVKDEIPMVYRLFGRTGIQKIIPAKAMIPPKSLLHFVFGVGESKVLDDIIDDTDPHFVKWAVDVLTNWSNEEVVDNLYQICGSKDLVMPPGGAGDVRWVEGGEHLMVLDLAKEVSANINSILSE